MACALIVGMQSQVVRVAQLDHIVTLALLEEEVFLASIVTDL
jgi:hypothetical protein